MTDQPPEGAPPVTAENQPLPPTVDGPEDGGESPSVKAAQSIATQEVDKNWPPDRRLAWGLAAVVLWLALFAAGVLVPSEKSRERLGWRPESKQEQTIDRQNQKIESIEESVKNLKPADITNSAGDGTRESLATDQPAVVAGNETIQRLESQIKKTAQDLEELNRKISKPEKLEDKPSKSWDFLVATSSFMPLNIGYLCILAAFIGGCSVNKEEIWRIKGQITALKTEESGAERAALGQRLNYLTEHPGYSAIRGLVVYLVLVSGLFIAGVQPLNTETDHVVALTQYMKLAGLFSFIGYMAGYDPTVFTTMINFGSTRFQGSGSK